MIKCIFVLKSCILFFFHFSFPHFSWFVLLSYLRKFLVFSVYGLYNFERCEQYVGAGIRLLMSLPDGLGLSIFCRKMGKARSMREEMDRKVVYFRQSRRLDFDVVSCKVLFPICTFDLACKQLFSAKENIKIGEIKYRWGE